MQLRPEQLSQHLKSNLLPVYLITGDEPLQLAEAGDAIRAAARSAGYSSREVLDVNREFSWAELNNAANSLSLFAEQRILELRLPTGSPGKEGSQALVEYVGNLPPDTLLLIQAGKIDKRSQTSKWFTALEKSGAVISIWPIKPAALPQWLQKRASLAGLQLERDATSLLVMRVEGNLLAAAQEIEKLVLLYAKSGQTVSVDARQVADAVADSARYSVYDLVDAAVAGESARSVRILNGLQAEGVAAPLILWALSNEVRNLSQMASRLAAGEASAQVLNAVWQNRKPLVTAALSRLSLQTWRIILSQCAEADHIIKGIRPGRDWDALLRVCLGLCGKQFWQAEHS